MNLLSRRVLRTLAAGGFALVGFVGITHASFIHRSVGLITWDGQTGNPLGLITWDSPSSVGGTVGLITWDGQGSGGSNP